MVMAAPGCYLIGCGYSLALSVASGGSSSNWTESRVRGLGINGTENTFKWKAF